MKELNSIEQYEKLYSFAYGTIFEYKGDEEHLVIPEEIPHHKVPSECGFVLLHDIDRVVTIDSFAFQDNLMIKSVVLPDTLREIDVMAFYGCRNLERIHIPKGVKRIKGRAFMSCDSLESVTIPDSVTHIGEAAFGYENRFYIKENFTIYGKKAAQQSATLKKTIFCSKRLMKMTGDQPDL